MNREDIVKYLTPALENLFGPPPTVATALELDKLLGLKEYSQYSLSTAEYDVPISEEYKKYLIALAGPHPHTVLKMIRINKGLE